MGDPSITRRSSTETIRSILAAALTALALLMATACTESSDTTRDSDESYMRREFARQLEAQLDGAKVRTSGSGDKRLIIVSEGLCEEPALTKAQILPQTTKAGFTDVECRKR